MRSSNRPNRGCNMLVRAYQQFKMMLERMLRWIDDFLSTPSDRRQGELIPIRTDARRSPRKTVFFDDYESLRKAILLILVLALIALGLNRLALP